MNLQESLNSPSSQPSQRQTTSSKEAESHHDRVTDALHQRMHDSQSHVRPGETDSQVVVHAQAIEGEDDGVEARGLFVEVVVVVRRPFDVGWEFGVHCVD